LTGNLKLNRNNRETTGHHVRVQISDIRRWCGGGGQAWADSSEEPTGQQVKKQGQEEERRNWG
jgi:hypothetical protein